MQIHCSQTFCAGILSLEHKHIFALSLYRHLTTVSHGTPANNLDVDNSVLQWCPRCLKQELHVCSYPAWHCSALPWLHRSRAGGRRSCSGNTPGICMIPSKKMTLCAAYSASSSSLTLSAPTLLVTVGPALPV